MYQLLIADDHPLFREAMIQVMEAHFLGARVQATVDLHSTLHLLAEEAEWDLLLLDLNMPDMGGLDGLVQLHQAHPTLPIVMISAEENREVILQSLAKGAVGYIAKTSPREQILQALEQLLQGQIYLPAHLMRAQESEPTPAATSPSFSAAALASLTPRQQRVLARLALGESNKQIAWHLNVAETTIKGHVSAIMSKLGCSNRVQLALAMQQHHELDS